MNLGISEHLTIIQPIQDNITVIKDITLHSVTSFVFSPSHRFPKIKTREGQIWKINATTPGLLN
jgi:hypothetical protein